MSGLFTSRGSGGWIQVETLKDGKYEHISELCACPNCHLKRVFKLTKTVEKDKPLTESYKNALRYRNSAMVGWHGNH